MADLELARQHPSEAYAQRLYGFIIYLSRMLLVCAITIFIAKSIQLLGTQCHLLYYLDYTGMGTCFLVFILCAAFTLKQSWLLPEDPTRLIRCLICWLQAIAALLLLWLSVTSAVHGIRSSRTAYCSLMLSHAPNKDYPHLCPMDFYDPLSLCQRPISLNSKGVPTPCIWNITQFTHRIAAIWEMFSCLAWLAAAVIALCSFTVMIGLLCHITTVRIHPISMGLPSDNEQAHIVRIVPFSNHDAFQQTDEEKCRDQPPPYEESINRPTA